MLLPLSFFLLCQPCVEQNALARITYYTPDAKYGCCSATGVKLHWGHCAVDPLRIPYGSKVTVPGLGTFLAVDTGTNVKNRKAARLSGRNSEERLAIVVDVFVRDTKTLLALDRSHPLFALVTWKP